MTYHTIPIIIIINGIPSQVFFFFSSTFLFYHRHPHHPWRCDCRRQHHNFTRQIDNLSNNNIFHSSYLPKINHKSLCWIMSITMLLLTFETLYLNTILKRAWKVERRRREKSIDLFNFNMICKIIFIHIHTHTMFTNLFSLHQHHQCELNL